MCTYQATKTVMTTEGEIDCCLIVRYVYQPVEPEIGITRASVKIDWLDINGDSDETITISESELERLIDVLEVEILESLSEQTEG